MHQSKKGNQWHFGMNTHIGLDVDSGPVHTVRGTSGHVNDLNEANHVLHGEELDAFGDAATKAPPNGQKPSLKCSGT